MFLQSQVDYLGHVILANGDTPDPDKIAAILEWSVPHSLTVLREFLGLIGFHQRF